MKRLICFAGLLIFLAVSSQLMAKCMYGSDWEKSGKKIVVCINGDSWSDRKKGKEICEKIKGGSCGSPSTFSSSCGNGQCYDSDGKNHWSLSGY